MKKFIRKICNNFFIILFPQLKEIINEKIQLDQFSSTADNTDFGKHVKVYPTYKVTTQRK